MLEKIIPIQSLFIFLIDFKQCPNRTEIYKLFVRFGLISFLVEILCHYVALPLVCFLTYLLHVWAVYSRLSWSWLVTVLTLIMMTCHNPLLIVTLDQYITVWILLPSPLRYNLLIMWLHHWVVLAL
jgi:hypothetical protein